MVPDGPVTTAVIFDLDGTLVQTRVASWEIFSGINDEFGLGLAGPEEYFELFRGNVFASIRRLCRDDEHAERVKAAFLQRLRDGYSPPMIPGMVQVIRALAQRCTLAVMSSNAMDALRRILVGHDVALCFAHVFGGDVAPDKREAIRAFLADACSGYGRRCEVNYDEAAVPARLDHASTVLVTDTAGDVRDAIAEGLRVLGVAWGMHTTEELTAAGAEFVAIWPQEVAAYLLAGTPPASADGEACGVAGAACGGHRPDRADPFQAARAASEVRRERRRRSAASAPADNPLPAAAPDELVAALARTCRPV
jgi:phosphoglycolate phosphatase